MGKYCNYGTEMETVRKVQFIKRWWCSYEWVLLLERL